MASKNEQISLQPLSQSSESKTASRTLENDHLNTEKAENKDVGGVQGSNKVSEGEGGKNIDNGKKMRGVLDKELAVKTKQLCLLKGQIEQLEDSLRVKESQEDAFKTIYDETSNKLAKSQEELKKLADLKERDEELSEENSKLREQLRKKDEEIQRVKKEFEKTTTSLETKNTVQKILQKENDELHHEKEQLKAERDRVRRSLKDKQEQIEKMNGSIGELQEQLFEAKRSLVERTRTSSLLEDRLANIDGELKKYKERLATKENKTVPEPRLHEEDGNENVDDVNMAENEKELRNKEHIASLQRREEKLVEERDQLEKQVNSLSSKIKSLEGELRNSRTSKQSMIERGSQTELTTDANKTKHQDNVDSATLKKELQKRTTAIKKSKGIVKSLGKFFEELIQNNQDSPKGSSRGRRTSIAARRANDLLHELSASLDYIVTSTQQPDHPRCVSIKCGSSGRKDERGRNGNLWDKVSHEVAHHEFTFESPSRIKENLGDIVDTDNEIKRAEKGLHKLYQASSTSGYNKQTEFMVQELLRKHHNEIKTLVEKACKSPRSSAATTVDYDENTDGYSEANLAVQELDNLKTRSAKVQSLVLKMQAFIHSSKNERDSFYGQLQALENELQQKDALLQAKTQELRRRHCKTLDTEKELQAQIESLKKEKVRASTEIARLHDLCRHKDLQMVDKVKEVKGLHGEIAERERTHNEKLSKMKKKVEEAWRQYTSVKMRAEKRSAEFNDAAEKLKVSQGYLLDLWQTLKTVDNVVETNEDL